MALAEKRATARASYWLRLVFVRLGVLPFLLLVAIVIFALLSNKFLSGQNILNVARQSTYLTMVAMGQMLALLTGGFDLSVGTTLAITSVVGAMAMAAMGVAYPDAVALSVALGMLAGLGAGLTVGVVNGIGVAFFSVSPFMMTLGVASIGFGAALYLTGGVPVYGMPRAFATNFGFGQWLVAEAAGDRGLVGLLLGGGELACGIGEERGAGDVEGVEEEELGVAAGVVSQVRVGGELPRCGLEGFCGGHERLGQRSRFLHFASLRSE